MKNPAPQIQIPVPCHENWEAMSSGEKGRFCGVCSKNVTDFSRHTKDEIISFMAEKTSEKVCGRVPVHLLHDDQTLTMPREQRIKLGKFAFALMLVFGNFLFGYSQEEQNVRIGKIKVNPVEQTQVPDTVSLIDTLQNGVFLPTDPSLIPDPNPFIMGMMVIPVQPEPEVEMIKGEIQPVRKPEE